MKFWDGEGVLMKITTHTHTPDLQCSDIDNNDLICRDAAAIPSMWREGQTHAYWFPPDVGACTGPIPQPSCI